ncbi:MAG: HipA domain-containing protein [Streptosporangiaceae bacterium]
MAWIHPAPSSARRWTGSRHTYRHLAEVLASHAGDRTAELRRLAAMTTFTVAIGNTDAHLRNHADRHLNDTHHALPPGHPSPSHGTTKNTPAARAPVIPNVAQIDAANLAIMSPD